MCIKIYKLDPPHFLSAPGLSWEACLKMTRIKLELLTDKKMLYMFEKELEEECVKRQIIIKPQTINILRIMIKIWSIHFYNIWTLMIYMDRQ